MAKEWASRAGSRGQAVFYQHINKFYGKKAGRPAFYAL